MGSAQRDTAATKFNISLIVIVLAALLMRQVSVAGGRDEPEVGGCLARHTPSALYGGSNRASDRRDRASSRAPSTVRAPLARESI